MYSSITTGHYVLNKDVDPKRLSSENDAIFVKQNEKTSAVRPVTMEAQCSIVIFPNFLKKETGSRYPRTAAMGNTGKKCLFFEDYLFTLLYAAELALSR